ncbi:cytochrome C biogenesis protein CcmB [Deinococcus piscis]|uniref:Cytochrome C biogenesis protein CcmB n=1 Tax=Deinococcus piscis TaxID=394230 RepID=A0ABQ3K4M1_9DEIO|nr:heme exporter protein CcmB [Deinococcus piscis]GHF99972.1 cytochrome C biogenesis protein CcmB [Deinococcus piscis]
MSALHVAWAVAAKDLRLAGRTRDALLATAFYVALVLLVQGFALGAPDGRSAGATANLAAGAVWTALTLASAVAAGRAFSAESEAGALEQLLLYPAPPAAIYLGKLLGVLLPLLLIAAVTLPTGLLLFGALGAGQPLPWPGLLGVLLLGIFGLSAATTFYASLTVNLRAREALLPALAFPLLVPLVIATVRITSVLLTGGWTDEALSWAGFLLAFDLGTVVLAAWLFGYAVEG